MTWGRMKMSRVALLFCVFLCGALFISGRALAQPQLYFTNDESQLKNIYGIASQAGVPRFKPGEPVFGVVRMNDAYPDVTPFTKLNDDGSRQYKITLAYRKGQSWIDFRSSDFPISQEDAAKDFVAFWVVPDRYDPTMAGFDEFVTTVPGSVPADIEDPVFPIQVRMESNGLDGLRVESAFFIEFSDGVGPYAEWKKRWAEGAAKRIGEDLLYTDTPRLSNVHGLRFSADGTKLVGAYESHVTVWDFATGTALMSFAQASIPSVDVSRDGSTVFSAELAGTSLITYVWDVASKELLYRFWRENGFPDAGRAPPSLRLSPDGRSVLTGWSELDLWDVASGKLKEDAQYSFWGAVTSSGQNYVVNAVKATFSPNGKTIAVGYASAQSSSEFVGKVQVLDGVTLEVLGTLEGYSGRITSLAYSPDGTLLATGTQDHIKLWDLSVPEEKFDFPRQDGFVSVAFSPDGRILASGSDDGTITLWNVGTGAEARNWKALGADVREVAFTPDGKYVVSGDKSGVIQVWDSSTGALARRIPAKSGLIIE